MNLAGTSYAFDAKSKPFWFVITSRTSNFEIRLCPKKKKEKPLNSVKRAALAIRKYKIRNTRGDENTRRKINNKILL